MWGQSALAVCGEVASANAFKPHSSTASRTSSPLRGAERSTFSRAQVCRRCCETPTIAQTRASGRRGAVRPLSDRFAILTQMFDEKIHKDRDSYSLADLYIERQEQMRTLRNGRLLKNASEAVLSQLPPGELTLVSTSMEGAALAAVCASQRQSPTRWLFLELAHGLPVDTSGGVVVVEPIDVGSGWRAAVLHALPGARFIFPAAPAVASAA